MPRGAPIPRARKQPSRNDDAHTTTASPGGGGGRQCALLDLSHQFARMATLEMENQTIFSALPHDILRLVYRSLDLSDLVALGSTSREQAALSRELSLPGYLAQHHPDHRTASLCPPLAEWPATSLAKHFHLTSQRLASRRFVAQALALPQSFSSAASTHGGARRGAAFRAPPALRPLLAVGRTRVVVGGVGGRRGVLVVYDLTARGDSRMGGTRIGEGWEIALGEGIGSMRAAGGEGSGTRPIFLPSTSTPPLGEAHKQTATGVGGTGALLTNDLTGLGFLPSSQEEDELALSFANGLVQVVRLPPTPVLSAGKQPTSPPRKALLLRNLKHPPSPVQSLSIASSPSSSSIVLTASYGGLLSLHIPVPFPSDGHDISTASHLDFTTTSFSLPPCQKPWSTLLSPETNLFGVGSASPSSPIQIYSLDSSPQLLRTLFTHASSAPSTSSSSSAVYALHTPSSFSPQILISALSLPQSAITMHDLRLSDPSPVQILSDAWAEEGFYSCLSADDGRVVMGGMGRGGRIGIWDVRMVRRGAGVERRDTTGWTVFAPTVGGGTVAPTSGEVGGLGVVGGRVWGVTPQSAFCLDFSPNAASRNLYPSTAATPSSPVITPAPTKRAAAAAVTPRRWATTSPDEGVGADEGTASFYLHDGSRMMLGRSEPLEG